MRPRAFLHYYRMHGKEKPFNRKEVLAMSKDFFLLFYNYEISFPARDLHLQFAVGKRHLFYFCTRFARRGVALLRHAV